MSADTAGDPQKRGLMRTPAPIRVPDGSLCRERGCDNKSGWRGEQYTGTCRRV